MKDIKIYNERMCASLVDKIWFVSFLDAQEDTLIIDFGCGDGSMIRLLNKNFNFPCIGYDNNPEMIRLGLNSMDDNTYCSSWEEVVKRISFYPRHKKVIVFSSVLHEVKDKIALLENIDFNLFDYIVIREMFFRDNFEEKPLSYKKIKQKLPPILSKKVKNTNSSIIQSIMKSYYPENIDTEILEDYFSFKAKHIWWFLSKFKYIHWEHYLLPYWKNKFEKDWGIILNNKKTHVKLLFKNNKIDKPLIYNIPEND